MEDCRGDLHCRSSSLGLMNSTTSSSNIDTLCWKPVRESGASSPFLAAKSIVLCSGSMMSMESIGDKGPPCLMPLQMKISFPGHPFTIALVEEFARRPQIQAIHFAPELVLLRTSSRKGHCTVLKAFEISRLSIIVGSLRACKHVSYFEPT